MHCNFLANLEDTDCDNQTAASSDFGFDDDEYEEYQLLNTLESGDE